jgi:hypothetical protein
MVEKITTTARANGKLIYERAQEIVIGWFVEIPGIEVKVCHDG